MAPAKKQSSLVSGKNRTFNILTELFFVVVVLSNSISNAFPSVKDAE